MVAKGVRNFKPVPKAKNRVQKIVGQKNHI